MYICYHLLPGLDQHPCKKPGRVVHACNTSTGESETWGSLELTGQQWVSEPSSVKDAVSKTSTQEDTGISLWPPNPHKHTHMNTNTCTWALRVISCSSWNTLVTAFVQKERNAFLVGFVHWNWSILMSHPKVWGYFKGGKKLRFKSHTKQELVSFTTKLSRVS